MRSLPLLLLPWLALQAASYRVGTFRADATPDIGEPLIWVDPTTRIDDPLWAKGVVIDDGRYRYVLCAVDWCGIGGSIHTLFRQKLAEGAGTDISRVTVHSVHQHAAPYIEGGGYKLFDRFPNPPLRMSPAYLEKVTGRLADAVRQATARMQPFDRVGAGLGVVEQVASARRMFKDGQLVTRYSNGAKNPDMAALPEGPIDPAVRTVTFARGKKPLVRIHYYATHPQTRCCDGSVSADFVGAAREAVEKEDGVFQVYFTGCSGDVTVGKYSNGSEEARAALARRLAQGLKASIAATTFRPARPLEWRTTSLALPGKPQGMRDRLPNPTPRNAVAFYRAAIMQAFAERKDPIQLYALTVGNVTLVHLPGEPMLEFQLYAQRSRPERFVAVAGYGDVSPGYICTDQAFKEGGYEPGASNSAPGAEALLKKAITELLGK